MHSPPPLQWREIGRPDRPPVLLVHGFPIESSMWDAAAAALADAWRVILPDLRGFGASAPTQAASMAEYADDLALLLDSLGIDRPALLAGLSFGGYVVMEFLRRHPGRFGAVGLIDTREVPDTPEGAAGRRQAADRLDRGEPVSIVADPMLPLMVSPDASPAFREHWRAVMCRQSPVGVAAALRAMADRPDSTETLRSCRARALLVVGARDAITPVEVHQRMAALMPRSELHVIPRAGHMAPTEDPRSFASIVREFLGPGTERG
ncbi:MAG TPA: alpha/beta hydrolase [Phycisphaerales bacterium]|nr:alpha/beta hydrolase [Phycisphaerales bacterium]